MLCGSESCSRSDLCVDSEENPGEEEEKREGQCCFISSLKNESSVIGGAAYRLFDNNHR